MLEKILRLAQNDKEETETPQAFPSEMILPPIGKDEVYQAFPSEGKGDRRTAVDEVEKRRIKVCYWFSAILQMCATIILLKSYWFSHTSSASLRSAPSPWRGRLLFSLRGFYNFLVGIPCTATFAKLTIWTQNCPKASRQKNGRPLGVISQWSCSLKKGAYDAAQSLGRICTRRVFASSRRLSLLYNNKIILSTIFCDK